MATWVNNNSVSDISALAELTKLADLGLDTNAIADISPLAELTALKQLVLGNNLISDPLTVNRSDTADCSATLG